MNCDPEVLVGYLYDEIEPEPRAEVEAHLATCASCRAELEELSATGRVLRRWAEESAGPGLVFAEEPAGPGRRSLPGWLRSGRGLGLAGAAVAIALLLALGDFEGQYRDGRLSLSLQVGGADSTAAADPLERPATVGDLLELQQQSLAVVAAALEEGSRRGREDLELALVGFARQLQQQRYRDLQAVDERLVQQDWQTETRFRRNEDVLGRLVPAVTGRRGYE